MQDSMPLLGEQQPELWQSQLLGPEHRPFNSPAILQPTVTIFKGTASQSNPCFARVHTEPTQQADQRPQRLKTILNFWQADLIKAC